MNRKQLERLSPIHFIVVTILFSVLSSVTVYLVNRTLMGEDGSIGDTSEESGDGAGTSSVPVVPTVDPEALDTAPSHFTEATVLPGFTETGSQIEQDDDVDGRSPGGV